MDEVFRWGDDTPHGVINQRIALQIAPYVQGVGMMPLGNRPDCDILLRVCGNDGKPLVDVLPDGRVVLHEGYEPDYVARRFWSSLTWFMEQHGPLEL